MNLGGVGLGGGVDEQTLMNNRNTANDEPPRLKDQVNRWMGDQVLCLSKDGCSVVDNVVLQCANHRWINDIVSVVNEAYRADAYFKKPGMADRIDAREVTEMIERQDELRSNFCLCCLVRRSARYGEGVIDVDASTGSMPCEELVGVFMLEKKLLVSNDGSDIDHSDGSVVVVAVGESKHALANGRDYCCYFGLMSVATKYKGMGFGELVLNDIVVRITCLMQCNTIELLSISEASRLRNWYIGKCGFRTVKRVEAPEELLAIVLPQYDIYFWMMHKAVVTDE